MSMTYGALTVEGTSWTHPDNIALQLATTVNFLHVECQFTLRYC